jgi:AraC family transcriptional activator of pobA
MTSRKSNNKQTPVYPLGAFSEKASWADFYIETFSDHVVAHPFIDKPHKHDFYLILYVRKGSGTHTIDFTTYPVQADTIFLMTPGQVHSWTLSPLTDGYVVFFTRSFYQMQHTESNIIYFPFYHSL